MESKTMSYSVLGIVGAMAVFSTVLLMTGPSETGETVKPFDKVYIDSSRAYARMYGEDARADAIPTRSMKRDVGHIPSLQTAPCEPGYVKYAYPYTTDKRDCYTNEGRVRCCKRFESSDVLAGYQ